MIRDRLPVLLVNVHISVGGMVIGATSWQNYVSDIP
jgi:hypothetical protein